MMAVAVWCAQPTASQPTLGPVGTLDQFVCECTLGTWTCSGAGYVAGGPGFPCNGDAGSDAGDGG